MATCETCSSAVPDHGTYTWTFERTHGTTRMTCVPCSRRQLDLIETRLDLDRSTPLTA